MLIKKQLSALIFLCTFFFSAAFAQNDPVALLQNIADKMIAGLKTHKATLKSKPQVVYDLAYRYVVPYADLDIMSKRVLPPHIWNNASKGQRDAFKNEFTRTLIRTYASALSSYQDQSVRFFPVRGGGSNLVVNSEISGREMSPIRVAYRLVRSGNDWKVYDMSVEGVSMLESFRSQFADILSQGSMEQLLQRMKSHNTRTHS